MRNIMIRLDDLLISALDTLAPTTRNRFIQDIIYTYVHAALRDQKPPLLRRAPSQNRVMAETPGGAQWRVRDGRLVIVDSHGLEDDDATARVGEAWRAYAESGAPAIGS